jgi:membrane fusion protein (multidrug efflux system)
MAASPSPSARLLGARLLPALALGAVLPWAVACGGSANGSERAASPTASPAAEKVPVEVGEVKQERMAALYSTSATLRASRQATVTTRSAGVLRRLLVEEGQRVRVGQPVAELENDEQRIAHDRAKTTLDTRQRELDRVQRLFDQKLISEDAFEKARREAQDARHAVDLARLELAHTVIHAPFDAMVVRRHLDVGNTVTSGTPVYDLADISPLFADVNVPERHVGELSVGQAVRLTPDAAPAGVDAKIERISPAVDPGTGTVKVTLTVAEPGALRPGAFVRVDIVTDEHAQAIVVPRSAVAAEGQRWFVYRLAGDKVEKVPVALGFEAQDRLEVVSQGEPLVAGDRVVTAGTGALEDGATVEIVAAGAAAPSPAATAATAR